MDFTIYDFTYLITNFFHLYVIKKYMDVFFELKTGYVFYAILGYATFFGVTSCVYLWLDIPIVTAFFNIILLFGITFLYDAGIKKRLFSVFFIYATFALIELSVTVVTMRPVFNWFEQLGYADVLGVTVNQILQFFAVLLIQNVVQIKSKGEVPVLFLITSVFVPVLSIISMIGITSIENISQKNVLFSIAFNIFINAVVFLLYDSFSVIYAKQLQSATAEQERKYYYHQCQMMQESVENMRDFRHDINNHIMMISELIQKKQFTQAQKYIDLFKEQSSKLKTIYSETGNIAIDSILNYKLSGLSLQQKNVHVKVNVPTELPIEIIDISSILTNLLDNAARALSETENGSLFVDIRYSKGILFISLKNSFNGILNYENGELQSSKNEDGHGRGLKIVQKILDKYDGIMNITHDIQFFTVKVMLYGEKS